MSIQQANIEMKIFLKKFEKRTVRLDRCGVVGTRCLVRCGLIDFRKKPAQDKTFQQSIRRVIKLR